MTFTKSSQNCSCESHFYSHQVLIRAVRSEELSGQQELCWDCDHFTLSVPITSLIMTQFRLTVTTTNHSLATTFYKIIFNNLGCHSSRLFQSFAPNAAQTPDKQETIFVKARSGLRMPGCAALQSRSFWQNNISLLQIAADISAT